MGVHDTYLTDVSFDIGRQDEIREYDNLQIWASLSYSGSEALPDFSLIFDIRDQQRQIMPVDTLAGGGSTIVMAGFAPLPVGTHHLSIYADPTRDGTETNVLEIETLLASFEFLVHPTDGAHYDMPEDDAGSGSTTVTAVLQEQTGAILSGYKAYLQFNHDDAQTVASDRAGGDRFERVPLFASGMVNVWAIPIDGGVRTGAEMLTGNSSYRVVDEQVTVKAVVHVETVEVSASSAEEAGRSVSGKVGGEVNILDVVKIGGEQTTTNERKQGTSATVSWKVSYATGGLIVTATGA